MTRVGKTNLNFMDGCGNPLAPRHSQQESVKSLSAYANRTNMPTNAYNVMATTTTFTRRSTRNGKATGSLQDRRGCKADIVLPLWCCNLKQQTTHPPQRCVTARCAGSEPSRPPMTTNFKRASGSGCPARRTEPPDRYGPTRPASWIASQRVWV